MAVLPPDPVFCFKGDMGHIHSLDFCVRSGNFVAQIVAGTEEGNVYFFDLESNRLQHKQDMGNSIQVVHSLEDFKLITQEKEGLVKLWTLKKSNYTIERSMTCGAGFCKSILIDETLLVPQTNSCVDIIDINNFLPFNQLYPGRDGVGSVVALQEVMLDDNTYILAGYESGDVVLYSLSTFTPVSNIKLQANLTSLTYDPVWRRGVAAAASNILQVFTISPTLEITAKEDINIQAEGCSIVKVRKDQKVLVAGCWDGRIRVISWKTLRSLAVLSEHKTTITDVQYSPNPVNYWKANIMAVSGADGIISLWNLYN